MGKKFQKNLYLTAGFNTVSLGTGRKEFSPKNPRPNIDQYISDAGKGTLKQLTASASAIDDIVISNFMAGRFVKQGHLGAFASVIDPALEYKPSIRVEGACCSGGLGLMTSIRNVLSGLSDVSLTVGVEVQNTVKALYGADILAGAAYYAGMRKEGHAFFFPGIFDKRAKAYSEKYGAEKTRQALARWYENAILNARKCPEAQEHHNTDPNPYQTGLTTPNAKAFLPNLNVFDCSKVSDGGSSIIVASEEGLNKLGKDKSEAIQIAGYGHVVGNITVTYPDASVLETTRRAVAAAYEMAGIGPDDIGVFECHDCFTITGLLSIEAAGFAEKGKGADFVLANNIRSEGRLPTNTSGGLVGFGHYTGGTGIRQAVDVWKQLTKTAAGTQVNIDPNRPYGLTISMGGDDKSVVAIVYQRAF
ncbi:MAG: 3-ketoacyl-CoA thiolase [Oligoflexia bacterium]|nr:3-ketoacyl-CoA thiolase [Oligoflexia bacterium]